MGTFRTAARRVPAPLLVLGFAFAVTMCTSNRDDTSSNDAGIGGRGGGAGAVTGDSAAGQPGDAAVGRSCADDTACGQPPPSTCRDSQTLEYYTPVCAAGHCAITVSATYCGQCVNGSCYAATTTAGGFGSGGTGTGGAGASGAGGGGAGAGGASDGGPLDASVGQPCASDVDCGEPPASTCKDGVTLEYYTPVCRSAVCALESATMDCSQCDLGHCWVNGTVGGTAGSGG